MYRTWVILRHTFIDCLVQPIFGILLLLGVGVLGLFYWLPFFTLGEDSVMFKSVGLDIILLLVLVTTLFATSRSIFDEIEDRSMLTLMSKPVSRLQILTSKLLAALSNLLLTDLVISAASFTAIALFHGGRAYEPSTLVLVLFSGLILQLFFLCVGLVISLLVKRVRSVTPYSLGLGFGTYVLAAFSGVFGDVKLEYITPFKHLDPAYIVRNAAYDAPLVLLNVAVTVIALAVSYWLYIRRDIPAVS